MNWEFKGDLGKGRELKTCKGLPDRGNPTQYSRKAREDSALQEISNKVSVVWAKKSFQDMAGTKSRDCAGIGPEKTGQGLWFSSQGKRESQKGF